MILSLQSSRFDDWDLNDVDELLSNISAKLELGGISEGEELLNVLDECGLLDVPEEKKQELKEAIRKVLPPGKYRLEDVLFAINVLIEALNYSPSDSFGRDMIRLLIFLILLRKYHEGMLNIWLYFSVIDEGVELNPIHWGGRELIFLPQIDHVILGDPGSDTAEVSNISIGDLNKKIENLVKAKHKIGQFTREEKKVRNPGGIWARPDVIEFLVR